MLSILRKIQKFYSSKNNLKNVGQKKYQKNQQQNVGRKI